MLRLLIRFSLLLLVFFLVVVLLFFSFRERLLASAVRKVDQYLRDSRAMNLCVRKAGFEGLWTISLEEVSITSLDGEALVKIDSVSFLPDWYSILRGQIDVERVVASEVGLYLDFSENGKRLKRILARKDSGSASVSSSDFGVSVNSMLERFFGIAPQYMEIGKVLIRIRNDSAVSSVTIKGLISGRDSLRGLFTGQKGDKSWVFHGRFQKKNKSLAIDAYPMDANDELPMLKELYGVDSGYDTLKFVLSDAGYRSDALELKCNVEVLGLRFYHPKIASDTVRLDDFKMDTRIRFARNIVELDSATSIQFGRIRMHPYLLFESGSTWKYRLVMKMDSIVAGEFFASLPPGLFGDVRTVKAAGELSFRLDFEMDTSRCDSLRFNCSMPMSGFEITDFGNLELLKLNEDFIHEVYVKDKPVRRFLVGPANPDFTPLNAISPLFISAVLGSEDSHFFEHDGFNEDAFRESILANYKARSFVRGGSTISMQLVKNVFLTRKKTLARKLEEALIVRIMESGRLVSKERMLEVYFNIIELGPGIYGVGEASRFYFDKHPSGLDLEESLFLASILPLPRAYRSHFDEQGAMKPYMVERFNTVSGKLVKRGKITQEQFGRLKMSVTFSPRIGIGKR